ncbi:MAG: nucleotidyltransferase family protein [Deltaproteobacteria bacterium]|nr:nucleotidyltransferase family protein [Deltaproteobacteria bacterium]
MKAFLLAGGEGLRLRPVTETVPKCLLPIRGKPLLSLWLELCRKHGVTEVLINLHHLSEKVLAFLNDHDFGVKVTTVYEERLSGSAGTVARHQSFVTGEEDFFVLYADNLTNIDLGAMLRFHRRRESLLTMGLFRTDTPEEKGIVSLDGRGLIIDFTEKPARPRSNLANAGIYIAGQQLYNYLRVEGFLDFGFDVLPKLVGKMHGYVIPEYLLDIGTPATYRQAQAEWAAVEGQDGACMRPPD